jgi:prophage regulatory protein
VKFLRYPALRAKGISFSRVHIGRLERVGLFPMHIALGVNTIAWSEREIDAWLEGKLAERPGAPTAPGPIERSQHRSLHTVQAPAAIGVKRPRGRPRKPTASAPAEPQATPGAEVA